MDQIIRWCNKEKTVRTAMVILSDSINTILDKHSYPAPVSSLLSELLCYTTLLRSSYKYPGFLISQVQNDGPIQVLVAKCDHDYNICGVCRFDETKNEESLDINNGSLVTTMLNDNKNDPYQSIIEYKDRNIQVAIEDYYKRSEQIQTTLTYKAIHGGYIAVLTQEMPENEAITDDHSLNHYAHQHQQALSFIEIIDDADAFIQKIQETTPSLDSTSWSKTNVQFKCTCSIERMEAIVRQMGREEADSILKEFKAIEITCDFCNHRYIFDAQTVNAIFTLN